MARKSTKTAPAQVTTTRLEVVKHGEIELTCIGKTKEGVTAYLTPASGVVPDRIDCNWFELGKNAPEEDQLSKVLKAEKRIEEAKTRKHDALIRLQETTEQLKRIKLADPVEDFLDFFSEWQDAELLSDYEDFVIDLVNLAGHTLEYNKDRQVRVKP